MTPKKQPKLPSLAQRLKACEARNKALETQIRELQELIEGLAGSGQVTLIRTEELRNAPAFKLGYRRGYSAAIVIHSEEVARTLQEEIYPREDALRELTNALAGASILGALAGALRADQRDALRPFSEKIARDLYGRYRNADQALSQQGQTMSEVVATGVTEFHEALIMFATGRDNGEALAACDAIQLTIAGKIRATLAAIPLGRPVSEPRIWIGKRITEARQRSPELTYRAATKQLYHELLNRERSHELLEVEEQALAKLDTQANGIYRDYGNLPDRVVTYCKRAAEDWRQKKHE